MVYGYQTKKAAAPGPDGQVKLLVAEPTDKVGPLPGVLWIHGGGYVLGMASMVHMSRAADIARAGLGVVVSPEYRLACKAPYPAAVEDCYAALLWLKEHAVEFGVRDDQLFVGGESAGGGLAAAVCMMARDRGEVNVAFQMPLYPMLDCFDTETSRDNHGRVWNTRRNHWGWRMYLGPLAGRAASGVPPYASPARQSDYAGLPPAYTFVSTGEPFYAETLAYVESLRAAGVDAACDVYPGDVHAFDMLMPRRAQAKQAARAFMLQYLDAIESRRAPQP